MKVILRLPVTLYSDRQKEKTMPEIISAVYEGNGLVRLNQEPKGLEPQERLALLIVPVPAGEETSVEKVGIDGLRQQIQDFEAHYALDTLEFYARFTRGEMGDERDFIVWAGLHDLLQRMTTPHPRQSTADD
jgi:hypothetical protein